MDIVFKADVAHSRVIGSKCFFNIATSVGLLLIPISFRTQDCSVNCFCLLYWSCFSDNIVLFSIPAFYFSHMPVSIALKHGWSTSSLSFFPIKAPCAHYAGNWLMCWCVTKNFCYAALFENLYQTSVWTSSCQFASMAKILLMLIPHKTVRKIAQVVVSNCQIIPWASCYNFMILCMSRIWDQGPFFGLILLLFFLREIKISGSLIICTPVGCQILDLRAIWI